MPGLAVWSCLVYPHMNKSLPSLTSALAVAVDRASVWSYRGSQGPRLFQQDTIQFFVDMLRRNERDGSTSSSSLHDSSSGSRHGPWQLPRLSSQRTSSSQRTKVTTRLLPLPGKQTKPPSSPVRRVASAGHNCLLICIANIHRNVLCGLGQSGVRVLLSKRRLPEIPCIVIPYCLLICTQVTSGDAGFSGLKSHASLD